MTTQELRERFLRFYEARGHTRVPSDGLVPKNDPSLLFTSAGMVQFKDMFLGSGRLPFRRACSVQKCLRVGDLERVGTTARHHTFFEMLGNFSFGDYFKEEAIHWAWEFLTEDLGIPASRLTPTVYVEDEEALEIWHRRTGLSRDRIPKFGEADNFWPANARSEGPNGPCGPCSEIYFDFGPSAGCGRPSCTVGCSCDRYVELYNLVFTQFERRDGGVLAPLKQKNIDTGMGLERLAAAVQGVVSNFDNDVFRPLVQAAARRLRAADPAQAARLRRIADHIRAAVFCIAEGIFPSNEERGYVVRRILRGAIRDGYLLGAREPFLVDLVPAVRDLMGAAYPELRDRSATILEQVRLEEQRFLSTLRQGMQRIEEEVAAMRSSGRTELDAAAAFRLHDTYGFPIALTRSILSEQGFSVDEAGFEKLLERQREASRSKESVAIFSQDRAAALRGRAPASVFTGHEKTQETGRIVAILAPELVETLAEGAEGNLVLDRTAFYPEGGGEVGDTGRIAAPEAEADVLDTRRAEEFILHKVRVRRGALRVGETVKGFVDEGRRRAIVRNHDATHLLQAALRAVLGTQVEQKGSLVAPDRLRFDFSFPRAPTPEELQRVTELVQAKIFEDVPILKEEMRLAEARAKGVLMFFGEKYGEIVRVVRTADGFSAELCGGCHGERTSQIGLFRIVAESSIGSGIRRIEAVTGEEAARRAREDEAFLRRLAEALRATPAELPRKVEQWIEEGKTLRKAAARAAATPSAAEEIAAAAKEIFGHRVAFWDFQDDRSPESMRTMMDELIRKRGLGAAILVARREGRPFAVIGLGERILARGLKAGELAKSLAGRTGGSGGGRDHLAQFGMADESKIRPAFDEFHRLLTTAAAGGALA